MAPWASQSLFCACTWCLWVLCMGTRDVSFTRLQISLDRWHLDLFVCCAVLAFLFCSEPRHVHILELQFGHVVPSFGGKLPMTSHNEGSVIKHTHSQTLVSLNGLLVYTLRAGWAEHIWIRVADFLHTVTRWKRKMPSRHCQSCQNDMLTSIALSIPEYSVLK